MDIAKLLKTALTFERKVAKLYAQAAAKTADPKGRRFLETMAKEEGQHVAYLEERTRELSRQGRITAPALATSLPDPKRIKKGAASMKRTLQRPKSPRGGGEAALLTRVVRAEEAVSAFYRSAAAEADGEARELFRRFLEIEDGHTALAQAELDAVTGLGFWCDVQEFDLEAA